MLNAMVSRLFIRALFPVLMGLYGAFAVSANQQYVLNRLDFPTGNRPSAGAITDLNGDGRQDLITVNQTDGTASVLLGKSDGTFSSKMDFSCGNRAYGNVAD